MNRLRAAFFVLAVLVCVAGCASVPPPADIREAAAAPPASPAGEQPTVAAPRPAEDQDLFLHGVALLNPPAGPDLVKARTVFADLIGRFPESRWRAAAASIVSLIDQHGKLLEACLEERLREDALRTERSAVAQENQSLQRALRELQERLQTETAALVRENEKLKTDIQRLKALEIELEKRERMLR